MSAFLTPQREAYLASWVSALGQRDPGCPGHLQRTAALSVHLAQALGLPAAEKEVLYLGALLHDVGKLGLPDAILLKPSPLTAAEWQLMRQHPVYAHTWLSPATWLGPALVVPHCHHERWDGSGYPGGLQGEAIPKLARLFAVVDVWDALRSERCYAPAWPEPTARAYLQEGAGRHFDPQMVEAFLGLPL